MLNRDRERVAPRQAVLAAAALVLAPVPLWVHAPPARAEPAQPRRHIVITSTPDPERDGRLPVDEPAMASLQRLLGDTFRRSETDRFVILSNCDVSWTRRREVLLERTYREVQRFADQLDLATGAPRHKLACVLFSDHGSYRAFASLRDGVRAHWAAGYYASDSNHVVFYDDRTSPSVVEASRAVDEAERAAREARRAANAATREHDAGVRAQALAMYADRLEDRAHASRERLEAHAEASSEAKTVHEAAHLVAFNIGLQSRVHDYPFWITEGIATNFETADPDRAFGPERPNPDRDAELAAAIAAGSLLPLQLFVKQSEAPAEHAEAARVMYTQAYGLFRFIARHERTALAEYLEALRSGPPGRRAADERLRGFERVFGDIGRLERRWLRYEADRLADERSDDAGGSTR